MRDVDYEYSGIGAQSQRWCRHCFLRPVSNIRDQPMFVVFPPYFRSQATHQKKQKKIADTMALLNVRPAGQTSNTWGEVGK